TGPAWRRCAGPGRSPAVGASAADAGARWPCRLGCPRRAWVIAARCPTIAAMLIRALIVLLLVINLGVALWWGLRPVPPAPSLPAPPPGVATLQLVTESKSAPGNIAAPMVPAKPEISQCASFGPFSTAPSLEQARVALEPLVLQSQIGRAHV